MSSVKKEKPRAACGRCSAVFYAATNPKAGSIHDCGKPGITGTIDIRERPDDWIECWACLGAGMTDGRDCPACRAVGWHVTR